MIHIYSYIKYSHKKKVILSFATWMNLEDMMLSGIRQTEKDRHQMKSLRHGFQKSQIHRKREELWLPRAGR